MTNPFESMSIRKRRAVRRYIRNLAKIDRRMPIIVLEGSWEEPREMGDSWHFETKGGKRIMYPSAYKKHGWSSMVYVHSTLRVEVGELWLRSCCFYLEKGI